MANQLDVHTAAIAHGLSARLRAAILLALGLLVVAPCTSGAGMPPDIIYANSFEPVSTPSFVENFSGGTSASWPAPWSELANSADVADVQAGAGRLRPVVTGYSLARMHADVTTADVEVCFTFIMEDPTSQGVGFYVRQNGGHLDLTSPRGQGYAVFVEGSFRNTPGVGVWKEEDGQEIQLAHSAAAALSPQQGIPYRARFRVVQSDSSHTLLQARVWPVGSAEPGAWQVSHIDNTPLLQNTVGGIAVDSWNVATSPAVIAALALIDDIEVTPL